jgi:hypothetical protein
MWTEVTGNSEYVIWLCPILHVSLCLIRERFSQNFVFLNPNPAYRPPRFFPPYSETGPSFGEPNGLSRVVTKLVNDNSAMSVPLQQHEL